MVSDCLVCREVAGELELPGGVLWEDENAIAFHIPGPVFGNAPGKPEAEIAASVGGSDDRGADLPSVLVRHDLPEATPPKHEVAAPHRASWPRSEGGAETPGPAQVGDRRRDTNEGEPGSNSVPEA